MRIAALTTVVLISCATTGADEAEPKGRIGSGERLYRAHCTLCHGGDGKLGLNGSKDLTLSVLTRAQMIEQVSNGKGAMAAYRHVLTAKEIEAVVDYTRSLGKAR
ncbi:MAG: cytochrome c [Flavobacteriales bacterium]|nr:cytochrome c [Flavobacteriales bacterium]